MRKKGSVRDVIVIGVLFFVLVTGFFIINFVSRTTIDNMLQVPQINSTDEAVTALNNTQTQVDRADYIAFAFLIGLLIVLAITGYFIAGNKLFMFLYFIFIIISVVVSMILSNVWEALTSSPAFGNTILQFPLSDYILSNFAIFIAIAGFIGLIAMFAKPPQ